MTSVSQKQNHLPPVQPDVRHVLPCLMLSIFLGALDQTIVSVALPTIARELHNLHMISWVVAGYLVAMTVTTPVFGKFSDLFGRRPMLLGAMAIFTVASLLCGAATSLGALIAMRVLQGVGAGGLTSISQAVIGDLVAPRDRGRYQGYFSSMYALASVAGPILGGCLSQYLSWRWIFWINVPLGLLGYFLSYQRLPRLVRQHRRPTIDYIGIVLASGGLTSLLIAMTLTGDPNGPHGGLLYGLYTLAAVFLIAFVRVEAHVKEPLIRISLFSNGGAAWALCLLFFANFQALSISILVPLRLQTEFGLPSAEAALRLMPLAMGMPLGAYCSGKLTAYTGRCRPQIRFGALLMPCALLALAFSNPAHVVVGGVIVLLIGVACGAQFPTSLVTVQNVVPVAEIGVATSTATLSRSLGGTVGVTLISTVMFGLLAASAAAVAHGHAPYAWLNTTFPWLQSSAGVTAAQGAADGNGLSFQLTLLVSTACSLMGVVAAWRLPDIVLRGRAVDKTAAPETPPATGSSHPAGKRH